MLALGFAAALASAPLQAPRGQENWVFRSVLDERARIVTVALHPRLWLAYDATNCGLWKAWNGGVKFDGAVYTANHGPQPTTVGARYILGEPDEPVWSLNGRPVKPAFRGYTWAKNQVELAYEFDLGNGRKGMVHERPEMASAPGGKVSFERRFRTSGFLGAGPQLRLAGSDPATLQGPGIAPSDRIPGSERAITLPARGEAVLRHEHTEFPAPKAEGGEEPGLLASIAPLEPQTPPQGVRNREPGLAMRVYWFNRDIQVLPTLVEGQSPNVSRVIPRVVLRSKEEFGGFDDHFLIHISGYMTTTIPGEYQFRVDSDDGHRFMIRDEIITENTGPALGRPLIGKFTLSPGEHPISLDFFENVGGELLTLEWKKPGDENWEAVPPSALSTLADEVRVTAPGEKMVMTPDEQFRPGDRRPLAGVHPSYDLSTIRPADFQPKVGGIDFLPDGRMVICNWEPDGGVYVIEGYQSGSPDKVKVKRIAVGLAEPLGIKVVDGRIYVLQKQELTRLDDLDGDGITDRYYAVANGWGVTANFHEFAFGLVYQDGYFYANLATAINPGGSSFSPQDRARGKTVRIALNGDYQFIAQGLRTPNGIGEGPDGEIFLTDNQGDWLPVSKLIHLQPGAFYGNRAVNPRVTSMLQETPPVVWLPQGEIGNSPGEPFLMKDGPYKGQMLHTDVTHGGLKRDFLEKVNGVWQGAVFRFTQGLEAGINRAKYGPDGAIYAGGIGSTGNWGQEGKLRYGLQRLKWNGSTTFEMLAVRALEDGFEVEFTEPLGSRGRTAEDWTLKSWTYVPTPEYGGPKIEIRNSPFRVASVSADGRKVRLQVDGLQAGRVYYLLANDEIVNRDGEKLWATEAWYTLNQIPGHSVNALTPQEKAEGFEFLFDGADLLKWTGYRRGDSPRGWQAVNGELRFTPGVDNGYLQTRRDYADFDLRFDFKIPEGGNSGVIYRADESQAQAWQTSYEYQLLDDPKYPNSGTKHHTAANYDMEARQGGRLNPPGQWNSARIVCRGRMVEHWLNGEKVLEFEISSPKWQEQFEKSKFKSYPGWGVRPSGRIVLQDHGAPIAFRSIRIREIKS